MAFFPLRLHFLSVFFFVCLLSGSGGGVDAGHVLVFPGEYSHWLNMRSIMEALAARNHSVTVLVGNASPTVDYNNPRYAGKFRFRVFQVPFTRAEMQGFSEDFIHYTLFESQNASLLQNYLKMRDFMDRAMGLQLMQYNAILRNATLMASLRAAGFDAVLSDPMMLCTDLLADLLGLPLVISLRFSLGAVVERHCGHAPAPASFVPAPPLSYSDHMTFTERLVNMVTYVLFSAVTEVLWRLTLDPYYSEIKGSPTSLCEIIGKADIWLIRTFWDLDYPRPFLPNFKFVGGLHCKPANQLPEEMEEFAQSSGDDGLVVFSLGSMVTNLTKERADVIAAGLARLPQKVIWRYKGEKPATLAPNTKIYHWIPQNDLLGHPKTKAFITHGGANGLYEAIYHGVPLVGIPLSADQPGNILRMVSRGAAVSLDFSSMTSEDLEEAIKTVIGDLSYKSSIQRLSALQRDQPVAPLDTAVFWIEFVMRHGGARHLRVQSHHLNWFQYHSLDTCAALLAVLCTTIFIFYKSLQFCLQKCFSKRSEQREKTE